MNMLKVSRKWYQNRHWLSSGWNCIKITAKEQVLDMHISGKWKEKVRNQCNRIEVKWVECSVIFILKCILSWRIMDMIEIEKIE